MDNYVDIERAEKIILAGKEWQVPVLVAKQNKIVDPLIIGLLPIFAKWESNKLEALSELSGKKYDDLLEIAFVAIKVFHKDLSKEEFLELPITLPELIAAFSVVAKQTGLFEKAKSELPGEPLGE